MADDIEGTDDIVLEVPHDGTPVEVPARSVRPNQLYLSAAKLAAVCESWDGSEPTAEGLPVRPAAELADAAPAEFDELPTDEWVLLDGHTRAFCARLAGAETLTVRYDTDDLALPMYGRCHGWVAEAGLETVDDLFGRVLDPETFEEAWIARCHAAPEYPDSGEVETSRESEFVDRVSSAVDVTYRFTPRPSRSRPRR